MLGFLEEGALLISKPIKGGAAPLLKPKLQTLVDNKDHFKQKLHQIHN